MTAVEFEYWQQFYRFEPFGDEWQQAAQAAWAPIAATGSKKESGDFWTVDDFLPFALSKPDVVTVPVSNDVMQSKMLRCFGPSVKRKKKET